MIGMRWSVRLSGLISTIILARLLVPEDFGIIAMAKIAMGLLEALATIGVDLAIIKMTHPTRDDYNTAWTIRLIQRIVLAAILFFCAPLFASYFNEPRTTDVVRLLALATMLRGLLNIGIVDFRKSLNFGKEFKYGVIEKISSVVIAIALALYLRNYWALAIAIPLEALIGVVLSYTMHPYRPRLSLRKFRSIWAFSFWLLLSRIGFFFNARIDHILVGGNFSTSAMGYYNFAGELGELPGNELAVPMRRAIFPNLATMLSEHSRFDQTILNTVGLIALILVPIGMGLAAIADPFFSFFFGSKWVAAVPMFQWLAIAGIFSGLSAILEIPLLVNGREKLSAAESWLRATTILITITLILKFDSLELVAAIRMSIGAVFFLLMSWFCTFASGISIHDIIKVVWRSFIGATIMHIVVSIRFHPNISSPGVQLLTDIMLGALVYVVTMTILWLLCGKPNGPEKTVLMQARKILKAQA
jgi:O-antigen/teichoic acid export membrane protein